MNEQNREARQLLRDTEEQFKRTGGEYWQGRKDGSRLMYSIYQSPEMRESMQALVESSPGSRVFDHQVLDSFIEDCVYNIAAIIYELDVEKKAHSQTKLNLRRIIQWHDNMAQNGLVPEINDHCLSRD